MLSTSWVRLYGPMLKLLLFWTGTLMSEATGFCTAFCRSAVADASLGAAGLSAVAAGLACAAGSGLSCANAGTLSTRNRERVSSKTRFIISGPSVFHRRKLRQRIVRGGGKVVASPPH